MLNAFLKILMAFAAGYGILVVVVYLMQGKMLYLADLPGRALEITQHGTSSVRQRQVYVDALEAGDDTEHALQAVVRHLIEEYHADL